jgi:hypothetical protein
MEISDPIDNIVVDWKHDWDSNWPHNWPQDWHGDRKSHE